MQMILLWIGRLSGLVGVLLCAAAVLGRIGGTFWFAGFQVGTILQGGIAVMLVGCLSYVAAIAEWSRK